MRLNEEFLGVDAGAARVGIARGSSAARIAESLATVRAEEALEELKKLAEKGIAGIVVGLPRSLQGEDTKQTEAIRDWVKTAQEKIQVPFYWQDEALTSKAADGDDAMAASIILQDFLDTPPEERVRC